ncbi:TolC family protein [Altericroceibacterium xinjiangense]|uniref:TolC family protein n=1 Tax=Altericroceibacterium xinjiangense TaxID=762261 RepID=UPI001F49E4D4|nr:TolC family protein [Altericroceibacterium xinjiangense]
MLLLPACLAVAACASPVVQAPGRADVAMPPDYGADYRPPSGTGEAWWTGFDDPALNALISAAQAENLDIAATAARLEAARALLRAERGDRLPSVDAGVSAGADLSASGLRDAVSPGVGVIFDPDLSGRLSAEIEAAAASAAAAEYLVADVRRLVAADVSQRYIEWRRTGERLALLDQSTELQQQTLRIVELRNEAGLSANLDVRRAAADLAQTRAQRGLLELQRAEAANALAVLIGSFPGSLPPVVEEGGGIPRFVGGPPRGVPADLLRRRPDLLVAEARLVEAAAQIGAERADLLPSLVIPGEIALGAGSLGGVLSDFLLTLGASLNLPLFDGGRRRAEIAAASAEAEARFADYRQASLVVLAEVENALVAIEAYSDRTRELAQAIEESETAFNQSNALYREGLASLFDVLDAQRQLIASRQALIDSEAALASSIVGLYAAVGHCQENCAR